MLTLCQKQNLAFIIMNPVPMLFWGALSSLAYAPLYWTPLFFVSGAFLCRTLYTTKQNGFFLGWLYGCGFFLASLFWAGNSLFLDAKRFAWLWPFGALLLPSFFGLYMACASAAVVWAKRWRAFSPIQFGMAFALLFSMAEWIQGHLLTGFPWTVSAAIWTHHLAMAQWAAYIGIYGLGFITWIITGLWGNVFLIFPQRKSIFWTLSLVILVFGGLWTVGQKRLHNHPTHNHKTIILRLVQPATPLKERMSPDFYQKHARTHLDHLLDLSLTPTPQTPTCTLWPEGSFPWPLHQKESRMLKQLNIPCLLMQSTYQDKSRIYNGLLSYCADQSTRFLYAKKHLLPFGEYIPGRHIIERIIPKGFLKKITPGDHDFSPGQKGGALYTPHCPPFFCLICYEIIFPNTLDRKAHPKAEWILNPTNDGWFGRSPGPYQHLALAQLRAIEYGLPIIRAAHSGISAVIDPLGRLIHTLPLGKRAFKDVPLPRALPLTPFVQYKHLIYFGLLISFVIFLFII